MNRRLPLKTSLFWIVLSSIMVVVGFFSFRFLYEYIMQKRAENPEYEIAVLVQTGPKKEALSTHCLAELMGLSGDKKVNLYKFSTRLAEKALLSSPLIKSASVTKIYPHSIYVDYTARQPIAILYDYVNTAIDQDGYIFPLVPFFTPKKLPEIYLGLMPFGFDDEFGLKGAVWHEPVKSEEVKLAYEIIETFARLQDIELMRVDVSNAYADSWGRREVVLVIKDIEHRMQDNEWITYEFPRLLRIGYQTASADIQKYLTIRLYLINQAIKNVTRDAGVCKIKMPGTTIDLRIDKLAYVAYSQESKQELKGR